ncbi:MAG: M6 family metalloprotease domain-containing protein [Clostridia bacterium]|nr:M6 family metalloprotease domain-containing protein [Clostridia bacterium]
MNRFLKHLLVLSVCIVLCALFAAAAFAVPAKPGTHADADAFCRSQRGELVRFESLPSPSKSGRSKAPVQPLTEKELPLLVVVLGFNNFAYANDYDWSRTIFDGEKSLSAYYTDMSFGKFTFVPAEETSAFETDGNTNTADAVNDGIVHLKLDQDHMDWRLEAESDDLSLDRMLIDAASAADPYVDFASYDKNGDGAITNNELALAFVVAGYEASEDQYDYKEGKEYFLWAHAWTLEDAAEEAGDDVEAPKPDGVLISPYIAIAEQLSHDGGQAPISVLAHELGHYLGLPDLYNTGKSLGEWKKYDVNYLSVMASGSWGVDNDDNYCPYSMDVWSRTVLGWCEPAQATLSGDFVVNAQSYDAENETFTALKVPTQRETEYYLLENRQLNKWDEALDVEYWGEELTNGLILWHIDMDTYALYEEANEVNNPPHRPAVMPLYPEGESGAYTFTGKSNKVDIDQPFFDKAHWESAFANLGASLNLPLYGPGDDANLRAARLDSGILVTFLDDSNAQMHLHVDVPEHTHTTVFVEKMLRDCNAGGTNAHWMCTICSKAFADEAAQTELTDEELAIAPAAHIWDDGEVFAEATETDEGLVCYHCTVCDSVRYEVLPQLPPQNNSTPSDENLCPYCGQAHTGFFGFFIRIFHLILNLFK